MTPRFIAVLLSLALAAAIGLAVAAVRMESQLLGWSAVVIGICSGTRLLDLLDDHLGGHDDE